MPTPMHSPSSISLCTCRRSGNLIRNTRDGRGGLRIGTVTDSCSAAAAVVVHEWRAVVLSGPEYNCAACRLAQSTRQGVVADSAAPTIRDGCHGVVTLSASGRRCARHDNAMLQLSVLNDIQRIATGIGIKVSGSSAVFWRRLTSSWEK
jgi:hypothetical protein